MASSNKNILLDEQLCFALYTANKRFNHFYAEALAPFKLTYPQYITLLALWENSPMTVRELGSHVNLDSGTLTPLLKRMQTQGWVERKRDAADERQVNISLSQKAIDAKPTIFSHVNECMSLLGMDEQTYNATRETVKFAAERIKNADPKKVDYQGPKL
ncbi:MarR family winged helix-turn-helix transcriptional regulator [Lactiplantibacillus mudanjiangensis]|uniref:HTH-type transcriptional regulator SarZ n=1 Tax=Lactiplantibacillus mudanjiangensis TaxID=1296538 RepID=A0A660E932_9LACO|nr:MarR family transcriptional regulator [Lactiplantibacillus mudanjiangensis]VDG18265.1 transcription regulator [Lactobacillus plantarum JDM1] [Lactiplantibacillus mudanjiangensis]VDG25766.1 transcription regulator [Lactobacillus plantarum JDM1] [Lactiplantibacillus mudanjiangensis]VDG29641.1 transcription regulator [Lactobacillus plantarum JDM1] [Lactiplantibacillus mudanjiangensis]VDG33689.1 transcription regulator [Lactobacillus plantarum JDM1] [Lactiplantibacillus mudanjiangensis]